VSVTIIVHCSRDTESVGGGIVEFRAGNSTHEIVEAARDEDLAVVQQSRHRKVARRRHPVRGGLKCHTRRLVALRALQGLGAVETSHDQNLTGPWTTYQGGIEKHRRLIPAWCRHRAGQTIETGACGVE